MEKLKSTFIYANKNIEVIKELSKHKNWVLYKLENGTKIPYQLNSYKASSANSSTWNTFDAVFRELEGGRYDGIGIMFSESLGITGIDIDKCVNPTTGQIHPQMAKVIKHFDSYTEYSPSGTGVHILVNAKIEKGIKKALSGNSICFEMYSSGRYFTFTANHLKGTPLVINERQAIVDKFYSGLSKKNTKQDVVKNSSPRELVKPDHELLEIARKAKNSAKFCSLFDKGDISGYPSPSEACQALVSVLAFYTKDESQIDRIFKMSALYQGKWIAKWDRLKDSMICKAFEIVEESIATSSGGTNNRLTVRESDPDDLDLAMGVIESIGSDNINYLQSSFWTWNENSGYWFKEDELGIKKKIIGIGQSQLRKVNTSKINSTLEMVRINAFNPNIEFDSSLDTVNCMNGELHFENDVWELKPHDKRNYNTYVIPVSYDPSAEAPRYEKFKQEIFQNDIDAFDKANALDEMLGYCLLKSTSFERFFMLIGGGSNGKSVLLNVLTELLGKNNVSSVCPSSLSDKFKRAHLRSKLANIVSEIPEGHIIADAEMKAIVSGDSINAEFKGQNAFEFRPFCTMIFATNHMPFTRDFSDAWFRRPIILEFNNKFEGDKCDRQLYAKLMKELPGILNCAIHGLTRLFRNQDFTIPVSSMNLLKEWSYDVNQVEQFVAEKCYLDSNISNSTANMYQVFLEFTKEVGIKLPLNRNSFRKRILSNERVKEYRTSSERGFIGLAIKDNSSYPHMNVRKEKNLSVLKKENLNRFK